MKLSSTALERRRTIAVFSLDQSLVKMITEGLSDRWAIETFGSPQEGRASLLKPGVGIVVVDDEAIEESTRGWLLGHIQKWAPHALVAYVAAIHSPETERRARKYRIDYYTSKPMDRVRTLRVLHSFERASR